MDFLYLMHLVQTKNDLNRRRRRFYHIMRGRVEHVKLDKEDRRYNPKKDYGYGMWYSTKHSHPAYSHIEGKRGYEKAKRDMKAMTKHMREVRTALGVKFNWDSRGAIHSVRYEGKIIREEAINVYATIHRANNVLLGR